MAKILLADDSTHAQRMGAKILTAEGHEVATVSNGQAAIHALEEAPPDLVIADIFMPGRNGYEVCHFVKSDERLKSIPVLLIIGAMEPYDPEEGKKAGADGLVTKPLESSNLVATVKDLLSAVARFAPARPKPSRKKNGAAEVEEISKPVEEPQWVDVPEEEITSTVPFPEKLVISQEMSQQPVGMLADLLGPSEASAPLPVEIEAAVPSLEPMPLPERDVAAAASPEDAESGHLLAASGLAPQLDIADTTVWTAEPAPITPEEEKLFEQPAANWGDLTQMVEQAEAASPATAPPVEVPGIMAHDPALQWEENDTAPVQPDALLEMAEQTTAETSTEPAVEHYEGLSEATVAHPEPMPPAQPQPVPVEESGPLEEIEAAPEERTVPPLEQRVRQAVEDLMPEILERVKQSLQD